MLKQTKSLAVFDMDHTISEDYLEECLFETMDKQVYNQKLERFYKQQIKWPPLLGEVLREYPPQHQIMENWLHKTKTVPGIQQLLTYLNSNKYEIILVSGGNSHLAERFLQIKGFRVYFSHIFAPKLLIKEQCTYQENVTECHLPICHHGFCKGHILDSHLNRNQYNRIIYFGDGNNDLCGIHKVGEDGAVFIRKDKYLHKKLVDNANIYDDIIRCKNIVFWENGHEVVEHLKKEKRI